MDVLFGDATTAMPTPATQAERGSLIGVGSPASMDLRRDPIGSGNAIPGLDIDPPDITVHNGKPQLSRDDSQETSEGVGGWISRMVKGGKGDGKGASNGNGSQYRRLDQADED